MLKTTFKETKTHVQTQKKTIKHIEPHKIPLNPLNHHVTGAPQPDRAYPRSL